MSDETDYLLVDVDDTSVEGYETSCESFESIIRSKAEEFTESPAKFPSENSIETALREDLQNEQEIKITGGYIKDSFNTKKTKFGEKLSECTRIPAVQSQINIGYSSSFATGSNNTWTAIDGISDSIADCITHKLGVELHEAADVTDTDIGSFEKEDGIGDKTLDSIKDEVRRYHDRPPKPEIDIQLEDIKDLASEVAEAKGNNTENDIARSNLNLDLAIMTEARHPALYEEELFIDGHSEITDNALEFCVAGGAQFFPPSGIDHAIEIKYFKTTASPGRGLEDDPPRWDRLKGDIKELEMLQKDFGANSTHLLIFSNHHIFEEYEDRKKALEDWCSEKNINLWYIYPAVE